MDFFSCKGEECCAISYSLIQINNNGEQVFDTTQRDYSVFFEFVSVSWIVFQSLLTSFSMSLLLG